jgi:hypothetical protein
MNLSIRSVPDEETPLLGGREVSDVETVPEPDSEAITLAGPSHWSSRTSSLRWKHNSSRSQEAVERTPLPWAQLWIVLVLQLEEPLTAQVISPVSSILGHWFVFSGRAINNLSPPSLHPRSV